MLVSAPVGSAATAATDRSMLVSAPVGSAATGPCWFQRQLVVLLQVHAGFSASW